MRIVRVANYVAPHSGGLRTSLRELGAGYLAAGHDPVLIIPGEGDSDEQTPQGRVITLSGPRLPFTGGYRALLRKRRVAALLSELRPDSLEVSDRTTLRWTGQWAREHGVPAVMISHENLTALMRMAETFGLAGLEALACGTPVVVSAESALPEVVGEAGAAVAGEDLSAGVTTVLSPRGRRLARMGRAAGRQPAPAGLVGRVLDQPDRLGGVVPDEVAALAAEHAAAGRPLRPAAGAIPAPLRR